MIDLLGGATQSIIKDLGRKSPSSPRLLASVMNIIGDQFDNVVLPSSSILNYIQLQIKRR